MSIQKLLSTRKLIQPLVSSTRFKSVESTTNNKYFDLNDLIKTVTFKYSAGLNLQETVTITSKYVDTGNKPNAKGTVVTLSGSPGSHNDFKYMKQLFDQKNIRLICTNWPGSEFVSGGLENTFTNNERNSYLQNLMDSLKLQECNKIVVIGHSRGAENALQLVSKLSENKQWPIVGTVMINSPGFKPHKGINTRKGVIDAISYLIKLHSNAVNIIIFPILSWFYNKQIGLRVTDGKVAAASILAMQTFAFEKQKLCIDKLKQSKIRLFFGYGSKDFLIDEEDSDEVANYIGGQHYIVEKKEDTAETVEKIRKSFEEEIRAASVNFKKEGHYLQKTYPDLLVDVIESMFHAE